MKNNLHKNQKGFSHHFLMPVLAVLLVAGIGGYVMLRSSSAATYSKCVDIVKLGSPVVHCRWSDSKRVTLLYDIRVQKKSTAYRYLQVTPKSSTRTYDNGRAAVTVTPFKIVMICYDKNHTQSKKDIYTSSAAVIRMPIAATRCFNNVKYRVTQRDTKDGHTSKIEYTFSGGFNVQ